MYFVTIMLFVLFAPVCFLCIHKCGEGVKAKEGRKIKF